MGKFESVNILGVEIDPGTLIRNGLVGIGNLAAGAQNRLDNFKGTDVMGKVNRVFNAGVDVIQAVAESKTFGAVASAAGNVGKAAGVVGMVPFEYINNPNLGQVISKSATGVGENLLAAGKDLGSAAQHIQAGLREALAAASID